MATIQACELMKIVRNGTPYLYGVIGGTGGTLAALVGKVKPDKPMTLWLVTALTETELELATKAVAPTPPPTPTPAPATKTPVNGPDLTPPGTVADFDKKFPPSEDDRSGERAYRGEF